MDVPGNLSQKQPRSGEMFIAMQEEPDSALEQSEMLSILLCSKE
jgi:hypothetical protein